MRAFLVLAALSWPLLARAAAPRPELDALEARAADLESFQKGPSACLSSMTEAAVRAALAGGELSQSARGVLLTAALPSLERLYNARAFENGGPAVCDELAPLKATVKREKIAGDLAFDLLCKTNYYEALMAKATIEKQPTMFDLCLVRNRVGDRDFKLDSLDVSCRIIAERKGTVDEVCGRLGPYYDNASIAQTCPRMLRYVSGDETVCPLFGDKLVHERCAGYVGYKKAAAGDAAACAKEPHCRLMRGEASSVAEETEKEVVAAACGVYARPEILKERARALRAAIESALQREESKAAAGSELAEDAVIERAVRLKLRADLLAGGK